MDDEKLTSKQHAYAQNRAKGLPRKESSLMAGMSGDTNNASKVEEIPKVADEIARLRAETAVNAGITKEDVADGLKKAAEMAQTLADPTGMVAAWRELGKLLGFYAPEVKRLEKGINKRDLLAALDDLSDDELAQLSQGRVIEGKFTRVDESGTKSLSDLRKE